MTTTSLFKITPTPPTSIKLEPGQEGKLSFTVESLAAPDKVHAILLQALLVGEGGKGKEVDWLVAGPQRTLSMSGGKTETVIITARPTPTSSRGENSVKLVIADRDRPNDVYADSPPVGCEVSAPAVEPKPKRKLPWLLIAAIVGGLLVVVGGALLIWKLTGKESGGPAGLGAACKDVPGACDEGLVCAPGGKCLLAGGATCKPAQAGQCASGECESKAGVCAIPRGGTCNPGDKDLVPCLEDSACDPVTKTCLGNVGAACKAGADCVTGNCAGNVCAIKEPAVEAGDPCAGTCPAPLQCSATTKRCVEQLGRPCSKHDQCATGLCEASVCAKPEILRNCTDDGICDLAEQRCMLVQDNLKRCLWKPGHSCTSNGQCSSEWCNNGICNRDDGKCNGDNDCKSPYRCIPGAQHCRLLIGAQCAGDGQCVSNFCKNSSCVPSPCPPCQVGAYCDNATGKCSRSGLHLRAIERLNPVPWKTVRSVR